MRIPSRPIHGVVAAAGGLDAVACASMPSKDPLQVSVAGIEPMPGEGMELRLLVKLRIQNPNDVPIEFNGVALNLDVMGRDFASGVSDQAGTVPRFGEAIVAVPVTVSLMRMARQVIGMLDGKPVDKVTYSMSGKLNGVSLFGTQRFSSKGELRAAQGRSARDRRALSPRQRIQMSNAHIKLLLPDLEAEILGEALELYLSTRPAPVDHRLNTVIAPHEPCSTCCSGHVPEEDDPLPGRRRRRSRTDEVRLPGPDLLGIFAVDVAIATDHHVVETGPYRLVRHPSYAGAILAFAGYGICLGNWVSLLAVTFPVVRAFLLRIGVEERALRAALGDSYREYASRTRKLVPFVY